MRQGREGRRSTHDIDRVSGTGEAVWVVLDDVGSFEDALDGAGFDVELVVAEAIPPAKRIQLAYYFISFVFEYCRYSPLLWREIPVRDSTVAQVLPNQYIDTTNNMPHHAISNDYDFLKSFQDLADLFGSKPTHVTTSRHVRSVVANTTSRRHCREHGLAIRTQWCK